MEVARTSKETTQRTSNIFEDGYDASGLRISMGEERKIMLKLSRH